MAETPTDVLVAGYQEIEEATKDFESLVALVRDRQVSIEGVILVTHAEDGSVAVRRRATTWVARGWGGAAGSGSRLACSRRRCWRRPLSGRSRAG